MTNAKYTETPIWVGLALPGGNPHLPFPAPCSPAYPPKPGICPSPCCPGVADAPCLPTSPGGDQPSCTWSKLPCPCSSSHPGSRCTSPLRSCSSLPCAISSPTNAPATFASAHAQTDALASAPAQTWNLYPLFHLPLDVHAMLPLNPCHHVILYLPFWDSPATDKSPLSKSVPTVDSCFDMC